MTKKNEDTIVTYKGFTKDLTCTGGDTPFQYEVGKSYEIEGPIQACKNGFHACEYPLDVFGYYEPNTSRYAVVEQSGDLSRHDEDTKVASRRITVKLELSLAGLIKAAIEYTFARAKPIDPASPASATGGRGAASATGGRGAASATGDQGAASATGDQGAASATGGRGAASATGYQGAASALGKFSTATAAGIEGRARGIDGTALFLVYRHNDCRDEKNHGRIVHARAVIVGQGGIKPEVWYQLDADGNVVEVSE